MTPGANVHETRIVPGSGTFAGSGQGRASGFGGSVAGHAALLADFEATAARFVAQGAVQDAAATAQSAAGLLVMHHPGRFASGPLDRALLAGAGALAPVPWRPRAGRVLHVHSTPLDLGGHTRLAQSWIDRDAGRTHELVVTTPVLPVPAALAGRVAAIHELPGVETGLLARAAALRALAAGFEAVVLNLDPHDPLPALAFGGVRERPPVLAANVTDHTFGLGRPAFDLLVSNRDEAAALSVARRGLPAERCPVLPLPVDPPAGGPDRAAARAAIGVSDDALVLLTVGGAYKYAGSPHLLDAVVPLLERHPDAVLLAAGPEPEDPGAAEGAGAKGPDAAEGAGRWAGRWAAAAEATGGRVRALGRTEARALYPAADVYLESFPVGGSLGALEAAGHGLPVLSFAADPEEIALVGCGAAARGAWPRPATLDEYRAVLEVWLTDPGGRAAAGASAHAATALSHDPHAWTGALDELYARAAALGPIAPDELTEPPFAEAAEDRAAWALHERSGRALPEALLARIAARLSLASRSAAVRSRFAPELNNLEGYPVRWGTFERALAAPPPDAGAVAGVLAELRALSSAGLVDGLALAIAEDELETTVPLVEAALAADGDLDIDLHVTADPTALAGRDTLVVRR